MQMESQDNIRVGSSNVGGILSPVQWRLQEERLSLPESSQEIQQGLAVWLQPLNSEIQF